MRRAAWWWLLAIPVLAPVTWFHWDPAYFIFGGDTPTWISFPSLIEWHFPYLWDEFDGAGHPFANNVPLPTALFFWVLWKLAVPTLYAQVAFFVLLSALAAFGIYRIGRLHLPAARVPLFTFVAAMLYLLNSFGFYGENRRIFTTEFLVAYGLLPLFISYFLTAIALPRFATREALLTALTTLGLHNFNLIPVFSYVGVSYLCIAVYVLAARRKALAPAGKFLTIALPLSLALVAYHLYGMLQYYQVSNLASDLGKIVLGGGESSADILVRTLSFVAGGREIESPLLAAAYLLPLGVALTAFLGLARPAPELAALCGALLVASLFFMDAAGLATRAFWMTEATSSIWGIFRYPHIKFTAPYILSVALLCGITLSRFEARGWMVAAGVLVFVIAWNPRAFAPWMPIQLHKPDDWFELSAFAQRERAAGLLPRTLKIPSTEYFRDAVAGEEFDHTPRHAAEGWRPWMVHSSALGLLVPEPLFSLDLTVGARLNPCLTRIYRGEPGDEELRGLIERLGVERELLSKRFTFQRQYTPMDSILRVEQAAQRVRAGVPHGAVLFDNEGLRLTALDVHPRPMVYAAARAEAISPERLAACDLPPSASSMEVAYYSAAGRGHAAALAKLDTARVSYRRIAPGAYDVRLAAGGSAPLLLVFNATYADWSLDAPAERLPVDGFATAWLLEPQKLCAGGACKRDANGAYEVDLRIRYAPQAVYQALLFAAVAIAAAIAAALLAFQWRSRRTLP